MKLIHLSIVLFAFSCTILPARAQWWNSARPSNRTPSQSAGRTTFGGATFGYPIGTYTYASPRYSGSPGLSPAPGVSSHTGVPMSPGEFMYYNNSGIGYYRSNPNASQFPAYPAPIALGGGYYQLGGLTERLGYWRAASGYYYPWFPAVYMPGISYGPNSVIYSLQGGQLAPAQPAVGAVLSDMRQFIEQAKEKNQLDQTNYENMFLRVNDLTARASQLSAKNGGALASSDEQALRKEIDLLSADLARALNP